jgi:hypothetical protein
VTTVPPVKGPEFGETPTRLHVALELTVPVSTVMAAKAEVAVNKIRREACNLADLL